MSTENSNPLEVASQSLFELADELRIRKSGLGLGLNRKACGEVWDVERQAAALKAIGGIYKAPTPKELRALAKLLNALAKSPVVTGAEQQK